MWENLEYENKRKSPKNIESMKVKRIYTPAKRRQMQEEAEKRQKSQEQDVNDFYWWVKTLLARV